MEYNENQRDELIQCMIDFQLHHYLKGRDCNIIGENIKYFREMWNFSPKELCKRAEVSRSTLYKIESGKIIPKHSTLKKIINALSLNGDSFFDWIDVIEMTPKEKVFGDSDIYNIYKMEDEIMNMFEHHMCYYQNGKRQYFPQKHLEILKNNISAAFSILNLINHDDDQGEEYHMIGKLKEEE